MSVFTTWTGATLEFDKLDKYKPDIRDVAHALSLLTRYRGQIDYNYSVAQHSLLVEEILRLQGYSLLVRKGGLLHDAPEMLISDCPSPLKKQMPEFVAFEQRIGDLFNCHFQIKTDVEEIHDADKAALIIESFHLFPTSASPKKNNNLLWYMEPPKYFKLFPGKEDPQVVEQKFLAKYWELEYLITKERWADTCHPG